MISKKQTLPKKNSKPKDTVKSEDQKPAVTLWNFVDSIILNKKYLLNEETISTYDPYKVNMALSFHPDLIMYANELNEYYNLPKKLHYDYLINSIRSKKRFAKWVKYDKDSKQHQDILAIQEYYGYNYKKALAVLSILSEQQLAIIKQKLEKGGIVNEPN